MDHLSFSLSLSWIKFQPSFLMRARYQLAKVVPNLRPWEVLSLEQAMDQITYGGEWYREPLGSYTTGPPYIEHWNNDVKVALYFHCSPSFLFSDSSTYLSFTIDAFHLLYFLKVFGIALITVSIR